MRPSLLVTAIATTDLHFTITSRRCCLWASSTSNKKLSFRLYLDCSVLFCARAYRREICSSIIRIRDNSYHGKA